MKPKYLEFCGINSFSEPAKIDFTKLLEFGIFGIFGDTGSGKSTILDCIGFALYGSTARSRAGKLSDIINEKRDSAYVIFEFEIVFEGRRREFRVERELKRKGANPHAARVYEREGEALHAVTDGVKESEEYLRRVIGLEQKDFDKCIALPQGEFAQFVKSQRGDRLKLVSRLFDLEAYGDRLNARLKKKYDEANLATVALASRLATYDDVTPERVAGLSEEISRLLDEEEAGKATLLAAREEENTLLVLAEKRREREKVEEKFARLEAQRPAFDLLGSELTALAAAGEVVKRFEEGKALRTATEEAERALGAARRELAGAEKEYAELSAWDEGAADAKIEALTQEKARAERGADLKKRKESAEKRLAEISDEIRTGALEYQNFRYEEERSALEAELAALGAESFSDYLDAFGKDALFRKEYATFRDELAFVASRHGEAAEDIAPIAEKYAALAAGPEADFGALRAAFEAAKPKRKEIGDALRMLDKRKGKYEEFCSRLSMLEAESARLKAERADCKEALAALPDLGKTEAALALAKRDKRERSERRAAALEALTRSRSACAVLSEKKNAAEEALEGGKSRYRAALLAGGFGSVEEAIALAERYGDAEDARRKLEAFRADLAATAARRNELAAVDCARATEEAVKSATERRKELEAADKSLASRLAVLESEKTNAERRLAERGEIERAHAQAAARSDLLESLKKLIENNKFMEFVAEEHLEAIALHASERLLSLTGGRYFLRYDGGFFVGDNFNGGEKRAVYTLSGGETFLVSLSLALALGAEICQKSLRPIEFFFLDEGFGTLDSKLVETVTDSLEKLRSEHFSIGIISHVEELKHRIDRKLTVIKATEQRGSQILS